jgi:hypothetical protein
MWRENPYRIWDFQWLTTLLQDEKKLRLVAKLIYLKALKIRHKMEL